MGTYEKNMHAIEKKSIHLKDALFKMKKDVKFEAIGMEQAKSGDYISYIVQDNKKKYLGSRYNPIHEAERWVQHFQFNGDENVIGMLGFGVGYFMRAMIQLEQVKYVIVYEPDVKLFCHVLQHYDLQDILESEKVVLIVKDLNEEFSIHLMSAVLNLSNVKNVQPAVHPGYEVDNEIFFEQILDVQRKIILYLNTNAFFGQAWIENTLHNIKYLKESNTGHELLNVLNKDTPVIAVMAGPSVADAIEDLKMAKGIFPIFAVDRIVDFLMEHGVEPDAVFTVDAMIDFDVERIAHIPLVGMLQSSSQLFTRHTGKKILINCKKFPGELYTKLNKLWMIYPTACTVASLPIGMALGEGTRNIILVGQDLAFRGDVSHADGSKENTNYFDNNIFVEGIDGEKIRSRSDWIVMLNWYKEVLPYYPNCTVYDSKEVGAKISGTEQKKIRDLLQENHWERKDYLKCFNEMEPTFNEQEWEQVLDYFKEVDKDIENIQKLLPDALEACEYFLKYNAEERSEDKVEKNLQIMKQINHLMLDGVVSSIVEVLLEGQIGSELLVLNQKEDTFDKKEEKTYATAQQMYRSLDNILKLVHPKYKEMLQKL